MQNVDTHAADPDVAAPDTREEQIHKLIAQDTIIAARIKALKGLQEQKRAQLLLLMREKGYKRRKTPEGTASDTSKVSFTVTDRDKLKALFDIDLLLEHVSINKAFWEAARKAHIDIDSAVQKNDDPVFKVEARRTKDAKERRERIMEETRTEMEARVDVLARRMMRENAARSE